MNLLENKNAFKTLAKTYIQRDGIDKLLAWLDKTDFFVAPASTQYNLPIEGGLCQHSLHIVDSLINRYYGKRVEDLTPEDEALTFQDGISIESIMLVGLFANINKANCYIKDIRNVKKNGVWEQVDYWKWDEKFIYTGRGSKSVFILQQYLKLFVEEAQAIAFFMAGEDNIFSSVIDTTYKKVYETSNLALHMHLAEMEATYSLDNFIIGT